MTSTAERASILDIERLLLVIALVAERLAEAGVRYPVTVRAPG